MIRNQEKKMNIRNKIYNLLVVAVLFMAAACSDHEDVMAVNGDAKELKGINASMSRMTRATPAALRNYVGKSEFENADIAVFTTIRRTQNPINQFNYKDIEFSCAASVNDKGVTSVGWTRDKSKGSNLAGTTEEHPDRIYWSDAVNNHTFIAYCTPQQGDGKPAFDWKKADGTDGAPDVFYGSLGDPTADGDIDFGSQVPDPTNNPKDTISGNVELRRNDILLSYDTNVTSKDAIAELEFYHGLAQVRVIVNISEFSASGGDDTKSVVSNMELKNMLTMYKWRQLTRGTEALVANDQTVLDGLGYSTTPAYDQRKDVKLWIPDHLGYGKGSSKTFTFYGLAVPTTIPEDTTDPLRFSFNVTYPNPMDRNEMLTKTYSSSIKGLRFDGGKCTTITIALNHRNEKLTVGAEYDDWEFVESPDQGELKKFSTFVETVDRTKITLFGDDKATIDDATWLYVDATDGNKLKDVLGNDGSKDHPFIISTADQLVSFAYEVKGTSRKDVEYTNLSGETVVLAANAPFDFTGYYVNLDADITMQPNNKILHDATGFYTLDSDGSKTYVADGVGITWPGIGDASHAFNGLFNGGYRRINKLYGNSFFNTVGTEGIIDHIFINEAIEITGSGSIAEVNNGIICGSHVECDIVDQAEVDYCGSIVGINTGVLIACSHIGSITGNARILGALLGQNDGILVSCYNVGDAKNNRKIGGNACPAYAGVGDYTARSIAYCCYYNGDFYTSTDYDLTANGVIGHVAFPLTTAEMQSNKYVNQTSAQGEITDISDKTDEFFRHWSLNVGLERAISLLNTVYDESKPDNHVFTFHTEADKGGYLPMGLTKLQVKWLIDHYDNNSHQFKFVPATYPKLK